ncbi:MAG TPA: MarR family winged helix-turn-helix transcriptional regulator [Polyangiaceae bacterium]|jgi:DNA-binding MarR family transcriptional regulator|nr:MarR family winged helix-turn-helix transcriptional regulator [Polyangiaceae bacterium]
MKRGASGFGSNEPLALLHFGFRAVVKEPDRELLRRRLGRLHHRILFFIARSPGLPVGELLDTLEVTKQALHAPLRALVRQKLVAVRVNPDNRRQRRLHLTPEGERLEERLSGHQRRLFAEAFQAAGPHAASGWSAVMRVLAGPALVLQRERMVRYPSG